MFEIEYNISKAPLRSILKNIGVFPYRIQTGNPFNCRNKILQYFGTVYFCVNCNFKLIKYMIKHTSNISVRETSSLQWPLWGCKAVSSALSTFCLATRSRRYLGRASPSGTGWRGVAGVDTCVTGFVVATLICSGVVTGGLVALGTAAGLAVFGLFFLRK